MSDIEEQISESSVKSAYQKPLPNESIYKHLMMLSQFCASAAERDKVETRSKAFLDTAVKLRKLAGSRAVKKLMDYSE